MHNNPDEFEPIIAERRPRQPARDETQPLWRLVLALGGAVVLAMLLAWWFMGRSSRQDAATTAQPTSTAAQTRMEIDGENRADEPTERAPAPPTREPESESDGAPTPAPLAGEEEPAEGMEPAASTPTESGTGVEQAAPSQRIPEVSPDDFLPGDASPGDASPADVAPSEDAQTSVLPAPVSVRFTSPDTQTRIELRGPPESSVRVTGKAGDIVTVPPGTYRAVASGPALETFEEEVTLEGERSYEYSVELCAQQTFARENVVGQVVEERACTSSAQCESMFMVLSEYADQLVRDRAFRLQQCAKWRANAAPDGKWTLDTKCGGATLATTCRIEIAEGACTYAEPARSTRGQACPRAQLK